MKTFVPKSSIYAIDSSHRNFPPKTVPLILFFFFSLFFFTISQKEFDGNLMNSLGGKQTKLISILPSLTRYSYPSFHDYLFIFFLIYDYKSF